MKYRLLYRPFWRYVIADAIALVLSVVIVLWWFPLSTRVPFQKYDTFALLFAGVWLFTSYLCHRYIPVRYMKIGKDIRRLCISSFFVFVVMYAYMWLRAGQNFSIWVLLTIWLIMFVLSVIFLVLKHAYRYALDADAEPIIAPNRAQQSVLKVPEEYTGEQREELRHDILEFASPTVLTFLGRYINLYCTNTFTLRSSDLYNISKLRNYSYDVIVNFMPLNQIRGLNRMFVTVNDKLPDDGIWVCCYEPQSVTKRNILHRYPPVINWLYYTAFCLYKRVLPRMFMTSRMYFDITEGKDRVLSKAEVLGRLCYCGFDIVAEQKVADLNYVVARRKFRPQIEERRLYGLLVKLNRVGKGGKSFTVYKFRTMHPYSEYLQAYIYDRYSLQAGGKFNHDIRVTTLGHFMRKYWIDEWPMLINLFRGEMKLVGVRPISRQYFSLYRPELQARRIQHKPGLLPPFYADMPETLEEIQDSEMRYLVMCEQRGIFVTDFIYFWRICYTILFKRVYSH